MHLLERFTRVADNRLVYEYTLDDPEIISVRAGESVLLRLVAASSSQNFYVDTGALEAELLAVDGKTIQPIKGNFFQLGVAQRLDLKVTLPKEGGAYPILAQGEGTKLLCGVVLVTKGTSVPQLSRTAAVSTAALDSASPRANSNSSEWRGAGYTSSSTSPVTAPSVSPGLRPALPGNAPCKTLAATHLASTWDGSPRKFR